jgi:hypothetical protein
VIALYLFAGLCLLLGGVIVSLQALRRPSPFPFLIDRGIDPHLWGFHVLGAGFMLSLVLMLLRQTPWRQEGLGNRIVVTAALVWMITALAMSVAAVLTRTRAGVSVPLFPAPDAKPGAWPGTYRAFIALGFVALCALGVIVF